MKLKPEVYVSHEFDHRVDSCAARADMAQNVHRDGPSQRVLSPSKSTESSNSVVWNNLSFEIGHKRWILEKGKLFRENVVKTILEPQSGELLAGTLTAIMGPSGAGKSTLLNCLTGHYVTGVKGTVTVTTGGLKPKVKIAYVPQKDAIFDVFTIRETLLFASKMKNFKVGFDHEARVTQVVSWLNLDECQKNRISKCSGGEVKRVCIGVELISSPDVLVIDEPTTGLDSSTAVQCAQLLRTLTTHDHCPAIVATIHQPNFKILQEFHKMYLLSKNGKNIFFGAPFELVSHFAKFGLNCPLDCNPVDFAIEVAYGDHGDEVFEAMTTLTRSKSYDGSGRGVRHSLSKVITKASTRKLPFWSQAGHLLSRDWVRTFRDSKSSWARLAEGVVVSLLVSFLWIYKVGENDACWDDFNEPINDVALKDNLLAFNVTRARDKYLTKVSRVADNATFLYSVCLYGMMGGLTFASITFPFELSVLTREMHNNWYRVKSYFAIRLVSDLPILLTITLLVLGICYPLTGQIPDLWRFGSLYGVSVLMGEVAQSLGMVFGALYAHDIVTGCLVTMGSTLPVMLFSGFFVRHAYMPWYYQYLSSLSYLRYAFECITLIVYGFGRCVPSLDKKNFIKDLVSATSPTNIAKNVLEGLNWTERDTSKFAALLDVNSSCLGTLFNSTRDYFAEDEPLQPFLHESSVLAENPSYVLSYYELSDDLLMVNIFKLLAMFIFLRIVVYFVLRKRTKYSQ